MTARQTTKAQEQIVFEIRLWKKHRSKETYKGTIRVIPLQGNTRNKHHFFNSPAQFLKLIEDLRKRYG